MEKKWKLGKTAVWSEAQQGTHEKTVVCPLTAILHGFCMHLKIHFPSLSFSGDFFCGLDNFII